MNPWGAEWSWILRSAVGGSLVLLLAWCVARRTRQPIRQQRLAEWGLAASLLVAALSLAPAWLIIDWPMPAQLATATSSLLPSRTPSGNVTPGNSLSRPAENVTENFEDWAPEQSLDIRPAPLPAVADVAGRSIPSDTVESRLAGTAKDSIAGPAESASAAQTDPNFASANQLPRSSDTSEMWNSLSIRWPNALALAYSLGVALFLLHWLLGQFALWRLLRTAVSPPQRVRQRFEALAAGQRARLLVSDRLLVPMSCGVLRPTVLVPKALCETGAERELGWVFAHELTHLARRDAWACLLFNIGRVVYFYLPWFWWLRRQARLCQEFIADREAAPEEDAADYAQFLLGLARAPALPAGATGVTGSSSDLYRRMTMLLKPHDPFEKRSTWLWSLAAALSFVALAVFLSGVGLHTYAVAASVQEVDKKDAGKKDEPKKEDPKKDGIDPDKPLNPDDIDVFRKDIEKLQRQQMEAMRKLQEAMRARNIGGLAPPGGIGGGIGLAPVAPAIGADNNFVFGARRSHDGRLGVLAQKPSPALVEQLDLPKGQGLVIEEVKADSAAAKGGIKAHDILLEINGKPVSDNPAEFVKSLSDIKPDKPVDAVVLRKGKKETIKGLTLPEAKEEPNPFAPAIGGGGLGGRIKIDPPNIDFPPFPGGGDFLPVVPPGGPGAFPGFPGGFGPGKTVMTTTFRTDDRFTTRHQEGSLIITVSGKVADGKATTSEIQVQDGNKTEKYESVDKVPEAYRDKVKNLVEMSEKGSVKIEIKK